MKILKLKFVFFIVFIFMSNVGYSVTKEEMKSLGNRMRGASGSLLNLPSFAKSKEILEYEKKVRDILIQLQPDLFQKYQLSVSIYSSLSPNAFMESVSAETIKGYKIENIYKELYHFDVNQPIYNLGITLGLFKLTTTKDELAFVLGHELTHLFENHVDQNMSRSNRWFSSQQFEAIADHKSIEMMLGKFDINSATSSLWKLAQLGPKQDFDTEMSRAIDAITKSTSNHHDPSVRISMAQSYVAYLQNSNKNAQPKNQNGLLIKTVVKHSPRLISEKSFEAVTEDQFNRLFDYAFKMIQTSIDTEESLPIESIAINRRNITIEETNESEYNELILNKSIVPFYATNSTTVQKYIDLTILKIIEMKGWTTEQKLAGLIGAFHLYSNFMKVHGDVEYYEHFLKTFSMAASRLVKKKSIDWNQFVHSSVFKGVENPEIFFYNTDLFTEIYFLPSIQRVYLESLTRLLKKNKNEPLNFKNFDLDNFIGEIRYISSDSTKKAFSNTSESILSRKKQQILNLALNQLFSSVTENELKEFTHTSFKTATDLIYFLDTYYKHLRNNQQIISIDFCEKLVLLSSVIKTQFLNDRRAFLQQLAAYKDYTENEINKLTELFSFTEKEFEFTQVELASLKALYQLMLKTSYEFNQHHQFIKHENILSKITRIFIEKSILPITYDSSVDRMLYTNILQRLIELKQTGEILPERYQLIDQLNSYYQLSEFEKIHTFARQNDYLGRLNDYVISDELKENREAFLQFINKHQLDPNKPIDKQLMSVSFQFSTFLQYNSIYLNMSYKVDYYFERLFRSEFNSLLNVNKEFKSSKPRTSLTIEKTNQFVMKYYQLVSLKKLYYKKYFPAEYLQQRKLDNNEILDRDFSNIHAIAQSLFDSFIVHQTELNDLSSWAKLLRSILHLNSITLESRAEYKESLEQRFLELSKNGTDPRAYQWLTHPQLKQIFSRTAFNLVLLAEFQRRLPTNPTTQQIRALFEKINSEKELKAKTPDVFDDLRKSIAENYKLQPHSIKEIFPDNDLIINTQTTSEFKNEIRGLSGFAAYLRLRPIQDQIEFIEYVMGHQTQMPQFIIKAKEKKNFPIDSIALDAKNKLSRSHETARAFFINSILTGPNAAMAKLDQQKAIIEYLMRDVSNKSIAMELADAMIASLGKDRSLFVAYIFAQKTEPGKTLTEGEILRSLFEAFGAPGIKLGQYLAFTGEMGPYQKDLAMLQDSALPISYLDLLGLLIDKLGMDWSHQWEVVRLLGSGSVNVAVEVKSNTTGEVRVVSILRQDIQTSAKNNFRLLRNFVNELVKRQAPGVHKYDFLPGLLNLNETSVTLEFNKQNAKAMQDNAATIYPRLIKGWTITVPKAFEVLNDAVSMEKASGKTARKIRQADFKIYQEVMGIVLNTEFEHLINAHVFQLKPLPSFANPDLHDGQVLIDIENKKISILDFGQAVSISKQERDLGLHLLRILGTEQSSDLKKQIQVLKTLVQGKDDFSVLEFETLAKKSEMMDRFIYLIGISENHQWNLPLSTVHFVLAMNRVIKLGDNIGYNITPRLKAIITTRAMTNSAEIGYYVSQLIESAKNAAEKISEKWQGTKGLRCEVVFNSR